MTVDRVRHHFSQVRSTQASTLLSSCPVRGGHSIVFFVLFRFGVFKGVGRFPVGTSASVTLLFSILRCFFILSLFPFSSQYRCLRFHTFQGLGRLVRRLLKQLATSQNTVVQAGQVARAYGGRTRRVVSFHSYSSYQAKVTIHHLLVSYGN